MIGTVITVSFLLALSGSDPSFEPFFASRMWNVAFGPRASMAVTSELVETVEELTQEIRSERAKTFERTLEPSDLNPQLSDHQRMVWSMVPFSVLQLRELPKDGRWNPLEIRLAKAVGRIAEAADPEMGTLVFGESPTHNRESLERIFIWFSSQTRDPLIAGYMIFTMDDGPWRPLPTESKCLDGEIKPVGDEFELRICRTPSGHWLIEGLEDSVPVWSRELAEIPSTSLKFGEGDAIPLGTFGWRINMSFGEIVHFYVDPRFEPMFYFTSW